MIPTRRALLIAIISLFVFPSLNTANAQQAAPPAKERSMKLVGKKLLFRYDSGLQVTGHYTSPSEVVWEALTGPSKGTKGTEVAHMAEITPDIYFVSWVEKGGTTVSQVLDMKKLTVTAFVTFDTPSGRRSILDKGTLAEQ